MEKWADGKSHPHSYHDGHRFRLPFGKCNSLGRTSGIDALHGGDGVTKDDNDEEMKLEPIIVKFLEDHRQAIDDGLREWAKGGQRRGRALLAIMTFLGLIVLFTGLLTNARALSAEAFTFLVGTVLMYLFNAIGPRIQIG